MNKNRKQVQEMVLQAMDIIDPTKGNSSHYAEIFASMDDNQFVEFLSKKFPYKFYHKPFVIEPTMETVKKALDFIEVPLTESITLPYLYKNKDGVPISTLKCQVGYLHIKNLKQFIAKKNGMSVNITKRDMKTGLLMAEDKGGKESSREAESLIINGCDSTALELTRPRADAMIAKNVMINTISTVGRVSLDDIPIEHDDPLSKNLIDAYMVGSFLKTNLIMGEDYMTPYTRKNRQKKVERMN